MPIFWKRNWLRKMSDTNSFVSIIVPVYNDYERLKHCLEILNTQTYAKQFYEIIVVDNNSTEDIKSLVEQFQQVKYAFEATPGSYSARNTGLGIAKGDIIGFTDSDCAPAKDWIERGVAQILKHPGCGFVAGKIKFAFQEPDNPNPAELYDSLNFLQQEKYVTQNNFGATANVFTTPEIFEAVGLFDASLKSGGDRNWGKRVHAAGYQQIYADDVEIAHPARASFEELNKKLCRVYEGSFRLNNKSETPVFEFLREIILDIRPPGRYLRAILSEKTFRGSRKRLSVLGIYVRLKLSKAITELRLYWRAHRNLQSAG